MEKMQIIMFNMSSYSEWKKGVVNRNYHVFNQLVKNELISKIIAVDFLPFTLKRTIRNLKENIIAGPEGKIIYRTFTTKCTRINEKLFIFSTLSSFFSKEKVIKELKIVLKKIKDDREKIIIWSYFPMFVNYFGKLNVNLTVFDAVDNWIEHPSFKKYKELLKENYKIIAQKSDLIFTVAKPLIDFFKDLGRKRGIFWIKNGVDFNHFCHYQIPKINLLKKIPHPIIGYVGTIQNRVDIDLLEYIAKKNPKKSIVLFGPIWPVFLRKIRRPAVEIKKLKKYKNIYLFGRIPYKYVPYYIYQFDVCLIPHRLDRFIKYTYSLKLLEYLACGKPVVTTPASGAEEYSHLIYIARDYKLFNKNIQRALNENNQKLKNKRIEAVKEKNWKDIVDQMLTIIKQFI